MLFGKKINRVIDVKKAEERFAKRSFAISFQNNTPVDSRP